MLLIFRSFESELIIWVDLFYEMLSLDERSCEQLTTTTRLVQSEVFASG